MIDPERSYMISIYGPGEETAELAFNFVPKGLMQALGPGGIPKRMPKYIVVARWDGDGILFDWSETQDDPGKAKADMEDEAQRRIEARLAWVDRVKKLVAQVEQWGRELGWETRQIEKQLDDSYVGKHRIPALLMQEETFRVLLEPIGRSAPGIEGIVDLYLMPAYDDIARLYYRNGRWNIHYDYQSVPPAENTRETPGIPLSMEALHRVLDDMRAHAA